MTDRSVIIENLFKCPICSCNMLVSKHGKSAQCTGENEKHKQHSFDFSSEGYLSIPGNSGGDSKEAVSARRLFLRSTGYYADAADAVRDTVKKYVPDCRALIDAGCGEGYYTSLLSEISDMTAGFDLSKYACAAGAKQARRDGKKNLLYTTASVFRLPLRDGCSDALTNIFAPCSEEEYCRVLRDGGYLFVVGAGKNHLMGLKRAIYDDTYENGERADLPQNMEKVDSLNVSYLIEAKGIEEIEALFSMTPYYWRTSERDKEKLYALGSLETEIEFEINVYRKGKG